MKIELTESQKEVLVGRWNALANDDAQKRPDQAKELFDDNTEKEIIKKKKASVEVPPRASFNGNPMTFSILAEDVTIVMERGDIVAQCIGGAVALLVLIWLIQGTESDSRRVASGPERCFSVGGTHSGLKETVKRNLNDPGSFRHDTTSVGKVNSDGEFLVRMVYRATNGFGGVVRGEAWAWVSESTCVVTRVVSLG